MSKRNSRAAKAARRAARLQRHARPMISVPGIPDMVLPAVLEVQLDRMEDEDERPLCHLGCEWGLQDDGVGVTDDNEDLPQLIADIAEDVRSWAGRDHLSIEWEIGGDAPAGQTVEDMIVAEGVVLPSAFPFEGPPAREGANPWIGTSSITLRRTALRGTCAMVVSVSR